MNIGYAMLYPYRGSIENMIYISNIMERSGHKNYFLRCNASVPYCHNRLLKGTSKAVECSKCFIGGVNTFPVKNITKIDPKNRHKLDKHLLYDIVSSSSFSLHRIETDEDCLSEEVIETQKKLHPLAEIAFGNAIDWISKNNLELVFIFNGRIDMPRAILKACEYKSIPYITFEAAYPGVALEINADCRSLKSLHKLTDTYKNFPLSREQAIFSAKIAAQMLAKKNLVWRLYNIEHKKTCWPKKNPKVKILIIPTSRHEIKDAPDWNTEWPHFLDGVEAVVGKLGANFDDCVVRCHPNWSGNIGIIKNGIKSERTYTEWAKKKGAIIIPSSSKASTNDLMKEADYVIVQCGTAGIEGALLGANVIGLSPSLYSMAAFSIQIHSPKELWKIKQTSSFNAKENIRKALRFLYAYHKRFAQYTRHIKPLSTYKNIYFSGADASNIFYAIKNNILLADDTTIAETDIDEEDIILKIMNGELNDFLSYTEDEKTLLLDEEKINRKFIFRWVDFIRKKMKAGDA